MSSNDIDDWLREAGEPERAAVDKVVERALTGAETSAHRWAYGVAVLAVGAAVVAAVGVWRHEQSTGPDAAGVYRVNAIPSVASSAVVLMVPGGSRGSETARSSNPAPAGLDGLYRAEATRSPVRSRVIRVTAEDGTTWILSSGADDALPAGMAIIVGGGDGR